MVDHWQGRLSLHHPPQSHPWTGVMGVGFDGRVGSQSPRNSLEHVQEPPELENVPLSAMQSASLPQSHAKSYLQHVDRPEHCPLTQPRPSGQHSSFWPHISLGSGHSSMHMHLSWYVVVSKSGDVIHPVYVGLHTMHVRSLGHQRRFPGHTQLQLSSKTLPPVHFCLHSCLPSHHSQPISHLHSQFESPT